MPDMTDHPAGNPSDLGSEHPFALPTRQKNILRNLLDKSEITPEEVAALPYRVVERAPGVGRQSLAIIRRWLHSHGLDLRSVPTTEDSPLTARRRLKLQRAIDYLRELGYEVTRSA